MTRKSLRIAQVAPLWTCIPPQTYGGIELLMQLLTDDLVERGHEVTLFASADCGTKATLHPVCDANLTELITRGEAYMFEYYASSMMAEVLRRAGDFDLIHYHLSSAWLPLAATVATPGLFTMHTSPHFDDEFVMRRWPQVAVCGISECQMREMSGKLGRKFPIIYNGCDFDAYEPRYEPGEYLAFLGRLSPTKNPLDAIRIAQAVDMPIVLAGAPQNASEEAYFHEKIEPLIDGKQVRWIGPVNHQQKSDFLRRASALLFPIQWDEPFGLVMIEAMACGTPVIATRRGSVEEVVEPGITGAFSPVPEGDDPGTHALAVQAMADLVGPVLQLDRRGVRARAVSRFGYRQMGDDYLALYYSMMNP